MFANGRPGWDDYYLGIARAVSARADCRRRKVGAVIVAPDNYIVATGYNGTVPGQPGCLAGACPRAFTNVPPGAPYEGEGFCIAVHAEENALIRSGRLSIGATIYCTETPCYRCEVLLVNSGIVRTVIAPK